MKKMYALLLGLLLTASVGFGQTLVQSPNFVGVVVPQYMASGTASRLPVAFRATVSGLTANTLYRYYCQGATNSTTGGGTVDLGGTNSGAGNPLLITGSTFAYTSTASLINAGSYGTFTSTAAGTYTGWFAFVNTGNARFTAGNVVYPTITLATDAVPATIVARYALDQTIKVLAFATTAGANNGTGIKGTALTSRTTGTFDKDVVALYDNVGATGRPLAATFLESIGVAIASVPAYYATASGTWNTIIPNTLTTGVQAIKGFKLSDGSQASLDTDTDGAWPSGANTVNPAGGTTPIIISSTDAPLPVTYLNFSAKYANNQVAVTWVTATERDNAYFDVERSADAETFTAIGRRAGKGLSDSRQQYSLTDETPLAGWNYYRLKQVDTDGTVSLSRPVAVLNEGALAGTSLRLFPNPASGAVTLQVDGNAPVQDVRVSNMNGRWLTLPASSNSLNTSSLPAGQYIVEIQMQDGRTLRQRLVKE
jgi:hypothetical protein